MLDFSYLDAVNFYGLHYFSMIYQLVLVLHLVLATCCTLKFVPTAILGGINIFEVAVVMVLHMSSHRVSQTLFQQ